MKLRRENAIFPVHKSRPTRGAWIETPIRLKVLMALMSRPTRGAWIETSLVKEGKIDMMSRPTRGAWIETRSEGYGHNEARVAPHTGRVD